MTVVGQKFADVDQEFAIVVDGEATTPPPPLVEADVDLRKMGYMPFFSGRCFASATWVKARSDTARVAMLKLWAHAWLNERPAGTVPNDQVQLCRAAGLTYEQFADLKSDVLRGFVLCSDGRLHHPFLADAINDLLNKRRIKAAEMRQYRAREPVGSKKPDVGNKRREEKQREDKNNPAPSGQGSSGPKVPDPNRPPKTARVKPDIEPKHLDQSVELYNLVAARVGWPQCARLSDPRRKALANRLRDAGGVEGWAEAMRKAEASGFLTGRRGNRQGWAPDFDFFVQQSSFIKLMEGKYDDRPNSVDRDDDRPESATDRALRGILASGKGNT